ncbi:MAG: hypothetical protein M1150_01715 [Patescibacteria group bacterium]|nr:hypothetical protein [Patescibacteria group bacterium]
MGEIKLKWLFAPLILVFLLSPYFSKKVESYPMNRMGPLTVEALVARGTQETGIGNIPVKIRLDNGQISESTGQTNEKGKIVWSFVVSDEARIRVSLDQNASAIRNLRGLQVDVFKDGTKVSGESTNDQTSVEVTAREGTIVKVIFLFESTAIPGAVPAPKPEYPTTISPPQGFGWPTNLREWLWWIFWFLVILSVILLFLFAVIAITSPNLYVTHWPAAYALVNGHPLFWRWVTILSLIALIILVIWLIWYR